MNLQLQSRFHFDENLGFYGDEDLDCELLEYDITCSSVDGYRRFGGTCCLNF
jgi:hypothetical protein